MATANVGMDPCATAWRAYLPQCWGRLLFLSDFPSPPMPPTVASRLPDGSEIPAVPASGEEASQTINAIVNQQMRDWQDQTQAFYESLPDTSGSSWLTWLLVAGGVIIGAGMIMDGSPRRYGR